MFLLNQTKHKWRNREETRECFMFIINNDDSDFVNRVWWWNNGSWNFDTYEQYRVGSF